ncbi:MAG: heme o synthase [Acidimicrobiia bacterium]|nr:protoheme IX farnesyltransferase [Acidimicrobiia bacterium]MDQ3499936.1 heme o synthase [Actinomycetota bacterium]
MASGVIVERKVVVKGRLSAYFALTKPRIIELLLITTVPSMVIAAGGWPGTWLVLTTLIGGTMSAAGANALNCYLDRDIDQVMRRTARRPLPSHTILPNQALLFGSVLGLTGFLWLGVFTNWLAASVSTGALLFYVFVYTRWLKRNSVQNIVIGGAAGAAPALVGWAAVTGQINLPAWVLFAVVFYWTPPHFWALAIRYRDEYAAAAVPMLPVMRGVEATTRQMVLYAGLTAITSLLLVPVAGMGWIYLVAAVGLGAWFLIDSFRVRRDPQRAMVLFTNSTYYLGLLFLAAMADVLVRSLLR